MWLRRTARVAAWGMALAGLAVVVVAWRCRTDVRLLWFRTGDHVGYVELTPRHAAVAYWRRAEYDGTVRRAPLLHHGRAALLTSVEPTPAEPNATAEKVADADRAWHALGFGVLKGNRFWPPTPSQREAWVPTWFLVAMAVAPLALMGLARRRRAAT